MKIARLLLIPLGLLLSASAVSQSDGGESWLRTAPPQ